MTKKNIIKMLLINELIEAVTIIASFVVARKIAKKKAAKAAKAPIEEAIRGCNNTVSFSEVFGEEVE